MVEFLIKFENRGEIKLLELTQFASLNLSIYINIVRCLGFVVMLKFCKLTTRPHSIYREVYAKCIEIFFKLSDIVHNKKKRSK